MSSCVEAPRAGYYPLAHICLTGYVRVHGFDCGPGAGAVHAIVFQLTR